MSSNTTDPVRALAQVDSTVAALIEALRAAKNTLVAFKFLPGEANRWEEHDEDNLALVDTALAQQPEAPAQEAVAVPHMFILGREYATRGGATVRLVSIHNAGTDHETMACASGIHRYTRRLHPLDFGRVTGTDGSDPRDLIPPAPQLAIPEGMIPPPRNRSEAASLAKLALAYLGVIDAHIDAAIARAETDAQTTKEPDHG